MKGLYFHINDFMTASFHPRGRPAATLPPPPPPPPPLPPPPPEAPVGNLYFIAREILAIYSRIRI